MKALAAILLICLPGVLYAVLFPISLGMGAHHTDGMHGSMIDCPFMAHEEVVCPMTVLDHLSILRDVYEMSLPSLLVLVLLCGLGLGILVSIPRGRPLVLLHAHSFLRWREYVTYRFSYRALQEFFAQGILHSRLFS